MIAATIISAAGIGPIAVWIALGLAIGFALHSARTRHDHAHHRTGSGSVYSGGLRPPAA